MLLYEITHGQKIRLKAYNLKKKKKSLNKFIIFLSFNYISIYFNIILFFFSYVNFYNK